MSDEPTNGEVQEEIPGVQNVKDQERKPIVITISLNPDGSMHLTGPLLDKIMMLGMMEMAKDSYLEHNRGARQRQAASDLVPAFKIPEGLRPPGKR